MPFRGLELVRLKAIRPYSAACADLIARIEARRTLVSSKALALRKRAFGARRVIDELDFIVATARDRGCGGRTSPIVGLHRCVRSSSTCPSSISSGSWWSG